MRADAHRATRRSPITSPVTRRRSIAARLSSVRRATTAPSTWPSPSRPDPLTGFPRSSQTPPAPADADLRSNRSRRTRRNPSIDRVAPSRPPFDGWSRGALRAPRRPGGDLIHRGVRRPNRGPGRAASAPAATALGTPRLPVVRTGPPLRAHWPRVPDVPPPHRGPRRPAPVVPRVPDGLPPCVPHGATGPPESPGRDRRAKRRAPLAMRQAPRPTLCVLVNWARGGRRPRSRRATG